MSRAKIWVVTGFVGFVTLTCSVAMAFLSDHHWYVGYQTALVFGRTASWVQLAGAVLSVIAGIGMSRTLPKRAAVLVGAALILGGLLLPLFFGAVPEIFNVHNWEIAMLLPVLVVLLDGAMLVIVGSLRWALQRG